MKILNKLIDSKYQIIGLVFIDILLSYMSSLISFLICVYILDVTNMNYQYLIISLFYSVFIVICYQILGGYRAHSEKRSEKDLEITIKGVSLGLLLIFLVYIGFYKGVVISRYFWVITYLFTIILNLFIRYYFKIKIDRIYKSGYRTKNLILVGSERSLFKIVKMMPINIDRTYTIYGVTTLELKNKSDNSLIKILGTTCDIENIINNYNTSRVVIFLDDIATSAIKTIINLCNKKNIPINLVSDFLLEASDYEITFDEYLSLIVLKSKENPLCKIYNKILKRFIDIVGSFLICLFLLFITPLFYLIFKIFDNGPIIYRRKVISRKGIEFDAYKIRTMIVNADEVIEKDVTLKNEFIKNFKLKDDPRITKIGRFLRQYSIDEFPQFVNVLKGEMSIVGPRMIVNDELKKYGTYRDKLLTVKPGITGFWQVNGRQNVDYEERVRMDMYYIDHWSIWLDILIILKTVWKVLAKEGAL